MKRQFFTLVEILTVTAIIAILAGITVGVVGLINQKNAEAKTIATIKALELALGQYKNDTGCFYIPAGLSVSTPQRLIIPKDIPANLPGTLWKYLDARLIQSATEVDGDYRYFKDGWGRSLIYRVPGRFNRTGFDLGSVGPDAYFGDKGVALDYNATQKKFTVTDTDTNAQYFTYFGLGDDLTNFLRK